MYVLTGFVVGLLTASMVTAMAAGRLVTVAVSDNVKVVFDGFEEKLPAGMEVLNYGDYNYFPLRYIAENLGAKVEYNYELGQIEVKSPEPKVVEVEVEKIVEVTSKKPYYTLPQKLEKDGLEIQLQRIDPYQRQIAFTLDVKDDVIAILKYKDCYIETDTEKKIPTVSDDYTWSNSLPGSTQSTFFFAEWPGNSRGLTLYVVVEFLDTWTSKRTTKTYDFGIILD